MFHNTLTTLTELFLVYVIFWLLHMIIIYCCAYCLKLYHGLAPTGLSLLNFPSPPLPKKKTKPKPNKQIKNKNKQTNKHFSSFLCVRPYFCKKGLVSYIHSPLSVYLYINLPIRVSLSFSLYLSFSLLFLVVGVEL